MSGTEVSDLRSFIIGTMIWVAVVAFLTPAFWHLVGAHPEWAKPIPQLMAIGFVTFGPFLTAVAIAWKRVRRKGRRQTIIAPTG